MSNIRVGVGKKGIVLALIVGVLLLGGGGDDRKTQKASPHMTIKNM